jgi:protein involved in polysaccharide export with SLBB domain
MHFKKLICLWLMVYMIFPPQCWSQLPPGLGGNTQQGTGTQPGGSQLENQAQFYLQKIAPQAPISGQLPRQANPLQPPEEEAAKVLTTAPRQREETSAAEKRAAEYGLKVKQFGYSFFYQPPETFLPVQAVPVGPNYLIGPGDSIKILLWGSVQGEYSLMVDRNGQISIPKVGVVQVSGLTFQQLKAVMDREFARQYDNFQMNVTLDNLRTIQVYVVGQARFPGSYAVSSLSTLISALFASGGPSKTGSLRDIQVRRGKKVITHFDMYNFLFRGDKSKDIRLQSEDVIFIPPIGPLAAIGAPVVETVGVAAEEGKAEKAEVRSESFGGGSSIRGRSSALEPTFSGRGGRSSASESSLGGLTSGAPMEQVMTAEKKAQPIVGGPVKVPAIYELKNERTLSELIKLAGGLSDTAFKGRVQVLRVQNHREMVLFEDDLSKVLTGKIRDVTLVDGDFVKIFPVPDLVEKKVRLAGAVKTVGEFGLYDNMRLKDLIEYAGGLLMEANREEAEITRVTITPQGPETSRIYISPRRALNGYPKDNILLKPNDYVFIRSIPEWTLYTVVKIEGEVKFPGNYAIKKGETMSSVLTRAGGFTDRAYLRGAFFTREAVKKMQANNLKQIIDRLEAEMYTFSAEQVQTSLAPEDVAQQKLILSQQQRFIAKMRALVPLGRVVIRLNDPERLRGTPDDLEMQDGDALMVPQIQQTVNVLGSVVNPTAVVYSPYLTVKNYIAQVGGPTRHADDGRTYVIKANGAALSRPGFFSLGIGSTRLEPGDSIVVPEDLERIAWLKEIKDIATIMGQIALTAGVVLVGLKR